ncbi:MAG TPA: hypothetical protein DDZ88_15530 [Verrucomicrobiales bacterium]|nr:hypothetical protein [Verrucomicrobiales bacterium]
MLIVAIVTVAVGAAAPVLRCIDGVVVVVTLVVAVARIVLFEVSVVGAAIGVAVSTTIGVTAVMRVVVMAGTALLVFSTGWQCEDNQHGA